MTVNDDLRCGEKKDGAPFKVKTLEKRRRRRRIILK
jgi:hypothetical protein